MKKEKSIFAKYDLAVKKFDKHNIDYQKSKCDISSVTREDKDYLKIKRKIYSHMRAANHNLIKIYRYDKLIKFYGTFYQVEKIGKVLAQVVSAVEGETFHFVLINTGENYQGLIVREHDARAYASLKINGDRDCQVMQFYGSLYDKDHACLNVNFGIFSYLEDYICSVVDYRFRHDIQDDYSGMAMEECYMSAYREFEESHHDLIKSKHQYLDEDEEDYSDAFILARTAVYSWENC